MAHFDNIFQGSFFEVLTQHIYTYNIIYIIHIKYIYLYTYNIYIYNSIFHIFTVAG